MPSPVEKLRNLNLRRLLHLEPVPLIDLNLPDEGDMQGLVGGRNPHLFLQGDSKESLWQHLDRHGILPALEERGFDRLDLQLSTADPEHQSLRLQCTQPMLNEYVLEMIVHRGMFRSAAPFAKALHGLSLPMLFIQWICLQNPLQPEFAPERPRLPGQSFPGLGLGAKVMDWLADLAQEHGLEAICNAPEFPHNALLYATRFHYFNPETEGILQAIKRDLSPYGLADISWGLLQGCVMEASQAKPFCWFHEEQLYPLSPRMREYVQSVSYREAVERAALRHRFHLDLDKLGRMPRLLPGEQEDPSQSGRYNQDC